MIDEAVAQQRKCEHQKNVGGRRGDSEKRKHELRATEVDAGERRDQADDVQPRDEPGGRRPAERRGPMVHCAGRGISRTQLRHAGGQQQREDRSHRPAERHLQRSAHLQAVAIQRYRAGEDGDDRERDREVGEPSHASEEFLGIAEAAQVLNIA